MLLTQVLVYVSSAPKKKQQPQQLLKVMFSRFCGSWPWAELGGAGGGGTTGGRTWPQPVPRPGSSPAPSVPSRSVTDWGGKPKLTPPADPGPESEAKPNPKAVSGERPRPARTPWVPRGGGSGAHWALLAGTDGRRLARCCVPLWSLHASTDRLPFDLGNKRGGGRKGEGEGRGRRGEGGGEGEETLF
jgi:hypothetical protein